MHVLLDVGIVSDTTVAALLFALTDYHVQTRNAVSISDQDNVIFRFPDALAAVNYLAGRMRDRPIFDGRSFHRRRVPIDGPNRATFRHLVSLCAVREPIELSKIRQFLTRMFKSRFLVLRPDIDAGRLILTEAGTGYPGLDENWRRRAVGGPLGEFDDPRYSSFVVEAYREAWQTGAPVLEEIDATMRIGSRSPALISYDRLLVPIKTVQGQALLSATLVRH